MHERGATQEQGPVDFRSNDQLCGWLPGVPRVGNALEKSLHPSLRVLLAVLRKMFTAMGPALWPALGLGLDGRLFASRGHLEPLPQAQQGVVPACVSGSGKADAGPQYCQSRSFHKMGRQLGRPRKVSPRSWPDCATAASFHATARTHRGAPPCVTIDEAADGAAAARRLKGASPRTPYHVQSGNTPASSVRPDEDRWDHHPGAWPRVSAHLPFINQRCFIGCARAQLWQLGYCHRGCMGLMGLLSAHSAETRLQETHQRHSRHQARNQYP